MEPEDLELTILMPCLNEAETVATCVSKAMRWLEESGVEGEVLVSDNGSNDGSQQLAAASGARVIAAPMRGYGAALAAGIAAARGRFVIMGDADDSYDFGRLDAFVERLRAGDELVMGNRFRGGIQRGAMPPHHYYLGNPVLSFVGRLFFQSPVRDFHCGMRGFNRQSILSLKLQTTGMEFASEMVVKATLQKLRITEVPTTLKKDGRSRPPHLRSWRDGWRHLRFLLMYSPRWLFLVPGTFLMVLGTALAAWILPGPRPFLGVVLDVHTLLAAAGAVIIGYQAVIFAVFTKVFAMTEGLLPPDARLEKLSRIFSLEVGLVIGSLLVVMAAAGFFTALAGWGGQGFGDLDPVRTMRLMIPTIAVAVLGSQTILASFFLSILGLARH